MSTFVTLEQLAAFLKAPAYATGDEATLLQDVLDAAIENVEERVGPLEDVAATYTIHTPGTTLVLPTTRLVEVATVTDPDGAVIEPGHLRTNLRAGIIRVPYRADGPWTVTATTHTHGKSVQLAVMIIAAHLWETQRGRGGGARAGAYTPVGDGDTVARGFAIPARAAELLAPFETPGFS